MFLEVVGIKSKFRFLFIYPFKSPRTFKWDKKPNCQGTPGNALEFLILSTQRLLRTLGSFLLWNQKAVDDCERETAARSAVTTDLKIAARKLSGPRALRGRWCRYCGQFTVWPAECRNSCMSQQTFCKETADTLTYSFIHKVHIPTQQNTNKVQENKPNGTSLSWQFPHPANQKYHLCHSSNSSSNYY